MYAPPPKLHQVLYLINNRGSREPSLKVRHGVVCQTVAGAVSEKKLQVVSYIRCDVVF
jgi:hypothetical protein